MRVRWHLSGIFQKTDYIFLSVKTLKSMQFCCCLLKEGPERWQGLGTLHFQFSRRSTEHYQEWSWSSEPELSHECGPNVPKISSVLPSHLQPAWWLWLIKSGLSWCPSAINLPASPLCFSPAQASIIYLLLGHSLQCSWLSPGSGLRYHF